MEGEEEEEEEAGLARRSARAEYPMRTCVCACVWRAAKIT